VNTNARYNNYLLSVLLVVLAFNWLDRFALGLMLQDIKVDLHLSDTQLGLITGIAFAVFYSMMGIPIARWADRGNRVTIIWFTTALWSVAVSLCGLVNNFVQLLLMRMAVGVGEAGAVPPAQSLIADHFPRAERPRATAIYALGAPSSMLFGYFLAGWLNELYGWRLTFILLGLPGLALAALARFTLRERRRARSRAEASKLCIRTAPSAPEPDAAPSAQLSFGDVCWTLWANSTFRHLLIGFSISHLFVYGIQQWQPAFFVRSFGLQTGELGTWLAVIVGLSGLLGTYAGGHWATRHPCNERLHLKAAGVLYAVLGVISPFIYLAPSPYLAFGLLAVVSLGYFATFGPMAAVVQTLVPDRMRATTFALMYFCNNLIGMGMGPLAVGALSDALYPWLGDESLRYGLLALSPGYFCVTWYLWQASRTVARDIDDVNMAAPVAQGAMKPGCEAI
jgi:MFS family permease